MFAPPAIVRAQSAQNRQSSETCEWLKKRQSGLSMQPASQSDALGAFSKVPSSQGPSPTVQHAAPGQGQV